MSPISSASILTPCALGEEDALHLGVNVERTKRVLLLLASFLAGLSVSLAGAIGFVGLVVPHFVRMFAGTDHRILLASSFVSGAIFLIFCDAVAKSVAQPAELPVGVVTGLARGRPFHLRDDETGEHRERQVMLELRHVSCRYDDHLVLKDIDVNIEDGDLVGVIGPNGSGKTTLIRAATRAIKPAEGEVLFKGKPLGRFSFKELAQQVAVVGRLYDLDVQMRVEDLVLLGRIPHRRGLRLMERRSDMDIAGTAMDVTGTLGLKDRFVDSLSSGERQLAFIARALAQEPELLLLDEPTSHLDITHQARVLDLVRKLNRDKGLTVLVVLHDLNLASQYCDRLFLLSDGVLRKDGTPDEVLTYQTIEEVYDTTVVVMKNPVSSRPCVFLVPEDAIAGVK